MIHRRPLLLGAGLALSTPAVTGCRSAARPPALDQTLTPAASVPPASPPALSRGFEGQVLDGHFTDRDRRTIPWRLRPPVGEGPVAWVVFSHGLGGNLDAGTDWARAWAHAGIATLHLQHAGSDSRLWRQGEAALRQAASGQQLLQRALDVRAAINQVQQLAAETGASANLIWQRLRADALGLAGHSLGQR